MDMIYSQNRHFSYRPADMRVNCTNCFVLIYNFHSGKTWGGGFWNCPAGAYLVPKTTEKTKRHVRYIDPIFFKTKKAIYYTFTPNILNNIKYKAVTSSANLERHIAETQVAVCVFIPLCANSRCKSLIANRSWQIGAITLP